LSIKALSAGAARPAAKPAPKAEIAVEDKLALLSSKWKTRT
jgi:hypothetical protein